MERAVGGGTVFRSARADQKVARRCEEERHKHMERIYTKLQAEFEQRAAGPGKGHFLYSVLPCLFFHQTKL